jgi:hypothetical protein
MSNLRTEQPVFETDRITDGFDIFFWVFNDASSFVATHWHTAIEIMYIIDGEKSDEKSDVEKRGMPGNGSNDDSRYAGWMRREQRKQRHCNGSDR